MAKTKYPHLRNPSASPILSRWTSHRSRVESDQPPGNPFRKTRIFPFSGHSGGFTTELYRVLDLPLMRTTHRWRNPLGISEAMHIASKGNIMSRIAKLFEDRSRKRFIAYICGMDPDLPTSIDICRALVEAGTDLLEIGVPFSDPLADGKTNQLAAERALANGAKVDQVFEMARALRVESQVPLVLYTYYNLVMSQGVETYVRKAAEAGIDGILTLDLPPEEAADMVQACKSHHIDNIFIVAPTTPEDRIPIITRDAGGFIYYVSREGVTGERNDMVSDLAERVALIKAHTNLPVGVGFGISSPEQVKAVVQHADAAIVGSALVRLVADKGPDRQAIVTAVRDKALHLISGLNA